MNNLDGDHLFYFCKHNMSCPALLLVGAITVTDFVSSEMFHLYRFLTLSGSLMI